ncbi:phosphonoacetaldehyde reductase [Helicobacter cappadocius]|uniref:Phosphonoacetaldehyde reductase n=1 Tax=Helicobacter cappadocius TaxID=3063998 RepID=A0AA90TAC8_9HELI|nr:MULTISPECIES: phosphonoacetaldehyde reductase [unclassified Helicobacter]MDO7253870.1 phosphonoacetaldehyde reductase [Helicobacter sp. faydin-H75]MDP2539812.1 phosphonoacetaldehyde reductase [Helicobacter sp. faydin-H76]
MNFNFYNPVHIEFGVFYLDVIEKIDSNNILLLTSKSFEQRGISHQIQTLLGKKLKKTISSIPSNPEIHLFDGLRDVTKNIDFIIALGGGSVIDTAKVLSVNSKLEISEGNIFPKEINPFIPIYAFPTTSGTSSELTAWATIWDKNNSKKYSLHLKEMYCKKAIYDPTLTLSLGRDLTISTALDALSHSIESIWNKNANPISTNNAINAINLITKHLPELVKNLDSIYLREQISLASVFAGLAFCSTQTAIAHAMSYPITMQKNIPHGIACSFTLPFLLENLPQSQAREILYPYKDAINNLFIELGIKTNFQDYGINTEELKAILNSLNARAKNSLFDIEILKKQLINQIQGK